MTTETGPLSGAPSLAPSPLSSGPADEGRRGPPTGSPEERTGDRLIALFWLGVLVFCPLAVSLFDRGAQTTLLGVPLLLVYLFAAWALIIAMLVLVIERGSESLAPAAGTNPDAGDATGAARSE